MVRLISRQRGGLAALKLTKLFGINNFPAAKDSGKVLIIIIYCYLIIIIELPALARWRVVRILTRKISQWARVNFCSYRKIDVWYTSTHRLFTYLHCMYGKVKTANQKYSYPGLQMSSSWDSWMRCPTFC